MIRKKKEIVLIALFTTFFLSSIVLAVDCPIPDTGQTKCYDDDSEITCPSPGEDFYGQDAQYICNPQLYTSLAGGIMVQDNLTGLIWEVKQDMDGTQNYTNPHDADNTYTWYDGNSGTPGDGTDTLDFIAALNSSQFGGYSDWRLPTVKELSFIRNMNVYNPAINTTFFPNTVSHDYWSSCYWSSTTYAYGPTYGAWVVDFRDGGVTYGPSRSGGVYVRAVRAGQCGSFDNFIDNGDGTVTNTDTGLMWQKDTDPDTYEWQDALSYCENLTLASHNDWRLPNVNELQSIVDYSTYDPSINTTFFPNTVSHNYWSSTTFAHHPYDAWGVWFVGGSAGIYGKSGDGSYVRAVRAGQCGPFDTSTTTTLASTTTTISGSTTTALSSTTSTVIPPCPSEEIYGEHSEQTDILRHFRDNVLSQTPEGQEIIRLYYEWSPMIVKAIEADEQFKREVKGMIDEVLELINEDLE